MHDQLWQSVSQQPTAEPCAAVIKISENQWESCNYSQTLQFASISIYDDCQYEHQQHSSHEYWQDFNIPYCINLPPLHYYR